MKSLEQLWEKLEGSEDDTGCDGVTVVDKKAWNKFAKAMKNCCFECDNDMQEVVYTGRYHK